MRVGLATSLVAHAVLITLGVVGLHQAQELKPTEVEAISVDLVPVTQVANIRTGSEQSKVIDTPSPAAVDTPTPAKLAERPGATQKDQPKPAESSKASPAPTTQTAPKPVPVPQPEATPKTKDAPLPSSEAKPADQQVAEAQPAPELATKPTNDTPSDAPAPIPAMPSPPPDIQPAQQTPTPEKTTPKTTEKPKDTKPADKVADIINTEASRGTTTGSGGKAAAGKATGQAAKLTQSELGALIAQMRKCWNPTLAERNDGVIIHLMVSMNTDGTVAGMPQILTDTTGAPLLGISARTAARKVAACGPFNLPADKYDHWRQIDVTLDASQAN